MAPNASDTHHSAEMECRDYLALVATNNIKFKFSTWKG